MFKFIWLIILIGLLIIWTLFVLFDTIMWIKSNFFEKSIWQLEEVTITYYAILVLIIVFKSFIEWLKWLK